MHEQFLGALESDRPLECLTDVTRRLIAAGYDRQALAADLEHLRLELRRRKRDRAEDTVLEVMDFLVGWCSPHARI
ncbi:MAG: hypothetical protein HYX51_01505 [Chloroflexi bacterium]|nr:hypothetical protein [Chloroflexota bacterium]